jgi:hypothetical protein
MCARLCESEGGHLHSEVKDVLVASCDCASCCSGLICSHEARRGVLVSGRDAAEVIGVVAKYGDDY